MNFSVDDSEESNNIFSMEQHDKFNILKNTLMESLRKLHDNNHDCANMYYISGGLSFLNIMKYVDKNIDEKINDTLLSKYIDYFRTSGLDIVCKDNCFDHIRTSLYNILTETLYSYEIKEVTINNRSMIYTNETVICKIINEKILERKRNNTDNKQTIEKFTKWPQTFMRFQMILNLTYNDYLNQKYYDSLHKMENKNDIVRALCDVLCGDGIQKINTEYKDYEDYYTDDKIRYMGLFSILKRTVRSIKSGLPEINDKKNINEISNYLLDNKDLLTKNNIIFFKLIKDIDNNMTIENSYIFNNYCNEIMNIINKQTALYNKYLKYKNKYISVFS